MKEKKLENCLNFKGGYVKVSLKNLGLSAIILFRNYENQLNLPDPNYLNSDPSGQLQFIQITDITNNFYKAICKLHMLFAKKNLHIISGIYNNVCILYIS